MSDPRIAGPQTTWTNVPPSFSGRQVEGASILPFGRYQMPDGSNQVSFGLPAPLLDAYRSMRQGMGYEQDPNAPQGFVSQEAIQRGANGLGVGAMVGSIPAGAATSLVRPGAAQLNSGFVSGVRDVLGGAARALSKSVRDSRARSSQSAVDEAAPYMRPAEDPTSGVARNMFQRYPDDQIHYYARSGQTIEQIAQQTGESPEAIANAIMRARKSGNIDPGQKRAENEGLSRLRREAYQAQKLIKSGRKGQDYLSRNPQPEKIPSETPAQITDDVANRSSNIEEVSKPAKNPGSKNKVDEGTQNKFWDTMEGRAEAGKAVPGKGSRKDFGSLRDELKEAGVEMSDTQIRKRLGIIRDSGKEGSDQADWIRATGPKGAKRLPGYSGGTPMDPTEPEAGKEFDHVSESGVVKVGD